MIHIPSAADVWQGLVDLGFDIGVAGDDLSLTGPIGELTPRRRELIRMHKPTLHRTACAALAEAESLAEREAIQWANSDDPAADVALAEAIAYFDTISVPEWIHNVEFVPAETIDRWFESLPSLCDIHADVWYHKQAAKAVGTSQGDSKSNPLQQKGLTYG